MRLILRQLLQPWLPVVAGATSRPDNPKPQTPSHSSFQINKILEARARFSNIFAPYTPRHRTASA